MQKNLGTYPQYPKVWDNDLTPDQNMANEDKEPGAPESLQTWELEDSGQGDATATADPADPTYYPDWYQPKLNVSGSTTVPSIATPTPTQQSVSAPDGNTTVCETTSGSPLIDDCVHAFGRFYQLPNGTINMGQGGSTWWASVSQTTSPSPSP